MTPSESWFIISSDTYLNQYWLFVNWIHRKIIKWNCYRNKKFCHSGKSIWNQCLQKIGHFVPKFQLKQGHLVTNVAITLHGTIDGNKYMGYIWLDTLRPRQHGRQFTEDIFKCIVLMKIHEFRWIFHWNLFLSFELMIFQHGSDNGLVQTGDKPLSETVMYGLLKPICVTRPHWV